MDAHHYTSRVDGVPLKLAHGLPSATCPLSSDTSLSNEFQANEPAGEQ